MYRLLYAGLLFFLLISCGKENIRIKGKIDQAADKHLYFEEIDVTSLDTINSVKLNKRGKFCFKTSAKYPTFYNLRFEDGNIIPLLAKPGEKVYVSGNLDDLDKTLDIKGSNSSLLISSLNRQLYRINKKLRDIADQFDTTENSALKDSLAKEYEKTTEYHRKYTLGFILTNPGSLSSYMALFQQFDNNSYVLNRVRDIQIFKIVTDSLTKNYPRSKYVKSLKKYTARLMEGYNAQRISEMAAGSSSSLPEINLPALNGDSIRLSSLKGKYILLEFWASQNKASISYNIKLKDVYNKYHKNGFEIYSVSLDNSGNLWQKAVHFDQLPWINVIDSLYPNSMAVLTYNVQQLPSSYLIGRDFETIIDKNINAKELDNKLKELLK